MKINGRWNFRLFFEKHYDRMEYEWTIQSSTKNNLIVGYVRDRV